MFDFGFEDYDGPSGGTKPPVSTLQVVQLTKIEVREGAKGPYLNCSGLFVEYNCKFYRNIFFPRNHGDQEDIKKDRNRFMSTLLSFGVPKSLNFRSFQPRDFAALLVNRFAQGQVAENDRGYVEPKWFKELTPDQSQEYRQPAMPSFGNQSP